MSINLNDSQFDEPKIFNNGLAGLVKNVTLSVEKKDVNDQSRNPDYRLVVTDSEGSSINQGFYYFEPRPGASEQEIEKSKGYEVGRLVHLARAVMGENAVLPEVNTAQEALDTVMKLVTSNAGSNTFNVFVTYGTVDRPSQYLGLRKFRFIEPSSVSKTSLVQGAKDNMTRLVPDAPAEGSTTLSSATQGW